jgi:tRNA threonylcarbamoyladenosine modification (KEOPS) complex  Pcc1 subunit
MVARAKANIRLKLRSKEQLTTLLQALDPETKTTVTSRAKVKLEKDGLFLVLTVDAEDAVALRSTLNAYLRWIGTAINVIDLVAEGWLGRLLFVFCFENQNCQCLHESQGIRKYDRQVVDIDPIDKPQEHAAAVQREHSRWDISGWFGFPDFQ